MDTEPVPSPSIAGPSCPISEMYAKWQTDFHEHGDFDGTNSDDDNGVFDVFEDMSGNEEVDLDSDTPRPGAARSLKSVYHRRDRYCGIFV